MMQDINIGGKVQEFRVLRKLSLRQLAARAEMTPSMLSQIENNGANPSINTLKAIARALDIPMFKFFQDDVTPDKMIVRNGMYKKIGNPGQEVFYQLLTPDTNGMIEFCLMEIPPQASSSDEPHDHNGEEVAYVVEGSLAICVGSGEDRMETGDSIRIPALSPHRWTNLGDQAARVIFAVTPPGF